MERRPILLFSWLILTALGLFSCDTQTYPPWISGPLWVTDSTGGGRLFYLTEEQRSKSMSRGRNSTVIRNYARYELYARNVTTGSLLKRLRIGNSTNTLIGRGPTILGVLPEGLWLWSGGLEFRDPVSLEVTLSESVLRERNPEWSAILPKEERFFKVSEPHRALIFKGLDARFFVIDTRSGKIALADLTLLEKVTGRKTAEDGFYYVRPPGQFPFYNDWNGYQVNSFLTKPLAGKGIYYGLFSSDERAALSKWPGAPGRVSGEVARNFYSVAYRLDDRNELEINPAAVRQLGDGRFLQGGFLKRSPQAVWDVPNPSSSLVLCKDALGKESPWVLVRLGRDGKTIWRESTGLAEISQIADGGARVILAGYATNIEPTRERQALLVWMDMATGKRQQATIEAERDD